MRALLCALILAAYPVTAAAQAPADNAATTAGATAASLIEAGETWRALYTASDWDGLAQLYTEDAVLMAHNSDKVEGRAAIVRFLRRLSDAGGGATIRFEPEEAVIQGNLGIVTARYWMNLDLPAGGRRNIAGRSLLIYKWNEDGWLLWRDMDNFAPAVVPDPVTEDAS